MAETERSGGNSWLAFLVGGLLVAVLVVGYFVFAGGVPEQETADLEIDVPRIETPDIDINPPRAPDVDIDLPDVEVNPPADPAPTDPAVQ